MAETAKNAGWYADPDGAAGERWWNGASWSDARRAGGAAVASTPIIYSADNPAPQRPDPYANSYPVTPVRAVTTINVSVNRNAMIGFVTGLIALFANVLFVVAPAAIVFSAMGLVKARALAAQGVKGNLMIFAVIGLLSGGIAALISIFSIIAFFASAFSGSVSG